MSNCELCGKFIKARNPVGVCQRTLKCKAEYNVRWHALNPGKAKEYRDADLKRNWLKYRFHNTKKRADRSNVPFSITRDDVPPLPEYCPVFGIKLIRHFGESSALPDTPTLDRIVPTLGYVPGNIQWLSNKANIMKSNATPEELLTFAHWIVATYGADQR